MRLIDADKLKEELNLSKYIIPTSLNRLLNSEINRCIEAIDNAPTVEVRDNFDIGYAQGYKDGKEERPQGEWVDEGQYAEGHSEHAYICKSCGYQIIEKPNTIFENRFCKCCGADMRGVDHE